MAAFLLALLTQDTVVRVWGCSRGPCVLVELTHTIEPSVWMKTRNRMNKTTYLLAPVLTGLW